MVSIRSKLRETLATLRGALFLFSVLGSFFFIFGVISLGRMLSGDPLGEFRLGNVPLPRWQGAGAANIHVFIFCLVGIVTVAVAIVIRYFYYRKTIEFMRSRGINDIDKDGKIDSFADKHWDDL